MASTDYTFEVAKGSKIIRSVRAQPPEHCRLQIKSFASVFKALDDDDSISSPEFAAAANTWAMSIHFKGETKDNGDHYVSLYLRKFNKKKDSQDVQVTIRFFIYDYIRDNFLIIRDSSVREYDSANRRRGLARAIGLKDFKDPKNGFVKNDRCTFGVEVFKYIRRDYPSASLVPFKGPNDPVTTKSWTSPKYNDLNNQTLSHKFDLYGRSWKFEINPKGFEAAKGKSLSLFLRMVDTSDLVNGKKVFAQFKLILKNHDPTKNITKSTTSWFSDNGAVSAGFSDMIPLHEVTQKSKGYLMNDCLHVKVVIQALLFFKIK